MSCDEPVALFMRESIIVGNSFGNCVLSLSEVNFIVGYLTIAC